MWTALAWIILLPLIWALLGAQPIARVDPLNWSVLPERLADTAPLGPWALAGALAVGALLALGPTARQVMHMGTLVHEVGHGLTAAALGGAVSRITMSPDGSGLATTGLPASARLRPMLVSLAGYLAPAILGLASLRAAQSGAGAAWLAYLTAVTVAMFVLAMRSWWAALVSVSAAVAGWLVVSYAPAWLAATAVAVLAGVLLARSIADAAHQYRSRRDGQPSDARNVSRATGIPAGLVAGLQLAAVLALTGAAGYLLLPAT